MFPKCVRVENEAPATVVTWAMSGMSAMSDPLFSHPFLSCFLAPERSGLPLFVVRAMNWLIPCRGYRSGYGFGGCYSCCTSAICGYCSHAVPNSESL
ncbi:hypothetical protein V6N11_020763 [Hibiscus sabdariffa]|uniref:Uncharacterized protein n=1 Tax=Hibiscus sabdariffa TaxID=183260 RepID=A0ABR2Q9D3_9ROSI